MEPDAVKTLRGENLTLQTALREKDYVGRVQGAAPQHRRSIHLL